jgi:hypothetical protein
MQVAKHLQRNARAASLRGLGRNTSSRSSVNGVVDSRSRPPQQQGHRYHQQCLLGPGGLCSRVSWIFEPDVGQLGPTMKLGLPSHAIYVPRDGGTGAEGWPNPTREAEEVLA